MLTENVSARDWIDLDGLFSLPNDSFFDPIITSLNKDVINQNENTFIIGINYYGAIFSAIIGYRYDIPFTYCFDKRKIVNEFEREMKNFDYTKFQRILLVADAMVYGNTICELINKMGEDIPVDILVLFERQIKEDYYSKIYGEFKIRDIYVLNDSFPIEICGKKMSDCIFRNNAKMNKYRKQIK